MTNSPNHKRNLLNNNNINLYEELVLGESIKLKLEKWLENMEARFLGGETELREKIDTVKKRLEKYKTLASHPSFRKLIVSGSSEGSENETKDCGQPVQQLWPEECEKMSCGRSIWRNRSRRSRKERSKTRSRSKSRDRHELIWCPICQALGTKQQHQMDERHQMAEKRHKSYTLKVKVKDPEIQIEKHVEARKHPVSVLYELCLRNSWNPPVFHIEQSDTEVGFIASVTVQNKSFCCTQPSRTKKMAKAAVADVALQGLSPGLGFTALEGTGVIRSG